MVPVHPVYSVQDWDAAPGAIVWPKLINFLNQVKEQGLIPPDHLSHDPLNEQKPVQVDESVMDKWREIFHKGRENKSERIVWGLVDGFLLYWHPVCAVSFKKLSLLINFKEVIDLLDVRLFLRVPEHVLKKRRQERNGYYTAGKSAWHCITTVPHQLFWPLFNNPLICSVRSTYFANWSSKRPRGRFLAGPPRILGTDCIPCIPRCSPRRFCGWRH